MDRPKNQDAEPYNPQAFPTLSQYPREQIEEAVLDLMKKHNMTREQALVKLEIENER
ncbi:MAG: hypothetical protein ACM3ZF_06805 [Mycobacterium leprae]